MYDLRHWIFEWISSISCYFSASPFKTSSEIIWKNQQRQHFICTIILRKNRWIYTNVIRQCSYLFLSKLEQLFNQLTLSLDDCVKFSKMARYKFFEKNAMKNWCSKISCHLKRYTIIWLKIYLYPSNNHTKDTKVPIDKCTIIFIAKRFIQIQNYSR